jgi:hypothetical protein
VVKGAFNVEHDGYFLAGFQIEILLDRLDVLGLPTVREIGGRIPRRLDRHMYANGSACLYLPEDLVVRRRGRFGIVEFIEGPVTTFFLGQAAVERGLPFPCGEWSHGADGMKDLLAGLLGFEDIATCVAFLDLLSRKGATRHWTCPCGSGRRIRDCHDRVVRRVRTLGLATRRFLRTQAAEHFGDAASALTRRRWRSCVTRPPEQG